MTVFHLYQYIPPRTWTVLVGAPTVMLWHESDGNHACRVEDGHLVWNDEGEPDNWLLRFVGPTPGRVTAPVAGQYQINGPLRFMRAGWTMVFVEGRYSDLSAE